MGPIAGELTIEHSDTRNQKQQHFPTGDGKENPLVEFQAGSPLHRRLPITYNSGNRRWQPISSYAIMET